jgi:hypothetical protein
VWLAAVVGVISEERKGGTSAVLRGSLRRYTVVMRSPMILLAAFAVLAALITATAVAD